MNPQKLTITLLLSILSLVTFAQNGIEITYKYGHNFPELTAKGTLVASPSQSKYTYTYDKGKIITSDGIHLYLNNYSFDWYTNATDNIAIGYKSEKEGNLFYKGEVNTEWEITGETQEILGYQVQKAIAKAQSGPFVLPVLQGVAPYNKAIVWFCPDLPYAFGPHRYNGLPGVILKIEFDNRSEYCIATNIKTNQTVEVIQPEKKTSDLKVNFEDFIQTGYSKKWWKTHSEEDSMK